MPTRVKHRDAIAIRVGEFLLQTYTGMLLSEGDYDCRGCGRGGHSGGAGGLFVGRLAGWLVGLGWLVSWLARLARGQLVSAGGAATDVLVCGSRTLSELLAPVYRVL